MGETIASPPNPPNPPQPTQVSPAAGPLPGQPPTQPYRAAASSAPAKRGWPGSAKVTAVVLAVTTLGAAATGVVLSSSAKSDTDEVEERLAASEQARRQAESDLEQSRKDVEAARAEAVDVQGRLDAANGSLATTRDERDAAIARADELRALFPLDVAQFADGPLLGSYALTVVEGAAQCSGYADDAAACSPTSFPANLEIGQAPVGGYTASSSYFGVTRMARADDEFRASGMVLSSAADLCNGQSIRTTYSLVVTVSGVDLAPNGGLVPTRLSVTFEMAAPASECTATTRSVVFDGVPA